MKVLLIYPPIQTKLPLGSFPLGVGYIAQILNQGGHSVTIYDINAFRYSQVKVEKDIKEFAPQYNVVAISGMVTVYSYIKWLIPIIKKYNPATLVIVGGSVASSIPQLLLERTQADIVCVGEGEVTIHELMKALQNSISLATVKGIWFKQDGKICQGPPRELIQDLDSIPFPAWDLFPIKIYIKTPKIIIGPQRGMNMISGRGCPYRCIYCYRNFGHRVRFRSIDNVIKEIRCLKEKYKVQHIEFQDELFTINTERVYAFCQRLSREKIKITWRCLSRVNLAHDLKILKLMKSAGCHWIGYGVESGSQKMLDIMHKDITVEQAKRALYLTRKAGIIPSATFMIGIPGETRETIRETVAFCKDTKIFNFFFFAVPYPGTYLFDQLKGEGVIKDEEEMILKIGGDVSELYVNMTELSNYELIGMKKRAEEDILDYLTLTRLDRIKSIIRDIINYYKWWGPWSAYRNILGSIKTYIKTKQFLNKLNFFTG